VDCASASARRARRLGSSERMTTIEDCHEYEGAPGRGRPRRGRTARLRRFLVRGHWDSYWGVCRG
jgi:hypothetical protein